MKERIRKKKKADDIHGREFRRGGFQVHSRSHREIPNHGYATRSKLVRCTTTSQLLPCSSSSSSSSSAVVAPNPGYATSSKLGQELVSCSKIRKGEKDAPFLPYDVICNILLRLPAKVLFAEMRCVCKHWSSVISDSDFIESQLKASTTGILVQNHTQPDLVRYLEATNGEAQLMLTDFQLPFPAHIFASCNGLVLLSDLTNKRHFHLVNLITKQKILSLPPVPHKWEELFFPYYAAFAFASSCGHYKVVHAYGTYINQGPLSVIVYTVNVDKAWRKLDLGSMPCDKKSKLVLLRNPICISGFIYWTDPHVGFGYALDVNTEKFSQFSNPGRFGHPLCLEANLGFRKFSYREDMWEFYQLVDVNSGVWTKFLEVSMPDLRRKVEKICGPHTLRGLQIFFYGKNEDLWFSYIGLKTSSREYCVSLNCLNTRNGNIFSWMTDTVYMLNCIHPHVNTLLTLKNS